MLYFKHADLAKKYHISLRTVHNWIDAAQQGKINLALHNENGRLYVANTARNIAAITELVDSGRKYRNTKAVKMITPKPEFYQTYDEHQIYDLATNLEIHHEIPRQYNYMDGGAKAWDAYTKRLPISEEPSIRLLQTNRSYLDYILGKYRRVNVVDIGPGNAWPVRALLTYLIEQGKMGRYIALDISPDMLKLAQGNIEHWFGDKVAIESYQRDINHDRFSDLLMQEYVTAEDTGSINVVLLFGGTLANLRRPEGAFKAIHDSMAMNDLWLYTMKLDTEDNRQYFDFEFNQPSETRLPDIHRLVVDLLNIEESFYEVEVGYDPIKRQRFERIRLNVSLILKLKFSGGERQIHLEKDSTIWTWRFNQQTAMEMHDQFNRNDFYLLHSSQTDNREYILAVARVKQD